MEFIQVLTILCLTFGIYCNDITSTRDIGIHSDDAQSSIIQLQTQLMDQTRLLREQSKIINELTNNVTELQESYHLQEQANKHQKTDIQDLKHQIAKQQFLTKPLQQSVPGGVVYTRWGRKECPGNGTELIYTGTAASGSYAHFGSAAEHVCLPMDPDIGPVSTTPYVSALYGTEYEENSFGYNLLYKDMPCAVCRANNVSSVMMIPGRVRCYDGWDEEYSGNLAGGFHDHFASVNYFCVDQSPDTITGGSAHQTGSMAYPVRAYCGILKCPPYEEGMLLKCVVCTK